MKDSLIHAFSNLWRRRGRTALTILSVVVGVMLVSAVLMIGQAGESLFYEELTKMGMDGLSVTMEDGVLYTDALETIRTVSGVDSAMPLTIGAAAIIREDESEETMLCGIDAGADQVISLELRFGRLISDGDVRSYGRVCLVEETYAREHYGRTNVVGETLRLMQESGAEEYTIIGVATAGSTLIQNVIEYIPSMVFIPYTTFQECTGSKELTQVAVRMEKGADGTALGDSIARALERQGDSTGTPRIENLAAQKGRLESLLQMVLWILGVISGVSLLVSGIGVMTIMLVSVQERVREIGVKKAVGATDRRILWEFLLESGMLAALGGFIGLLLGGAASCIGVYAVTGAWHLPLGTFAAIWLFTVFIGVLGGIFPALRASKLPPVDALCRE